MCGGGNKRSSGKKDKEEAPALTTVTVQPFTPGYDSLIAGQLAQGFGGTPESYLDLLQQTYQPMQVPDYSNWQGNPVPAASQQQADPKKKSDAFSWYRGS